MTPFLRTAIGFTTLMLLVVLPLVVFISRSRAKVNVALYWALLYPLGGVYGTAREDTQRA